MGVDVKCAGVKAFVFVGLGAALGGAFSTMINSTSQRIPATPVSSPR